MSVSGELTELKRLLSLGGHTLVWRVGGVTGTSDERGIAPLVKLYDGGARGVIVADRIVGKAAAMIYVLLGAKGVYADVMTAEAEAALLSGGAEVCRGTVVGAIRNRAGTGLCPMEEAVAGLNDPAECVAAVKKRLAELRGGIN